MIVTELQLAHIRAIQNAEFKFREGFNLLVGVNGVGKSTVLDALRICLSRVLRTTTQVPIKSMSFKESDIRNGMPLLEASISFDVAGLQMRYSRLEWRDKVAKDDPISINALRRAILDNERLRDRQRNLLRDLDNSRPLEDSDNFLPELSEWRNKIKGHINAPLAIFFATNRSVLTSSNVSKSKSVGGRASAYADALVPRSWNIRELADWLKVQLALSNESQRAAQHVAALQRAAARFLPNCINVRPGGGEESTLVIEKDGTLLDVRQLSDGERGVLSMVLDLARRLSQANDDIKSPLEEGQAIVLIDEIDLHLHPQWQRQIVHNLQATFPRCQFIATTHSPQVIGEVEPDRIQIIADGLVYSPTHSFGVDASRLLEEVMDTAPRTSEVQRLLTEMSQVISQQNYDRGHVLLGELVKQLGEDDPEVTRVSTLLDFLEGA